MEEIQKIFSFRIQTDFQSVHASKIVFFSRSTKVSLPLSSFLQIGELAAELKNRSAQLVTQLAQSDNQFAQFENRLAQLEKWLS